MITVQAITLHREAERMDHQNDVTGEVSAPVFKLVTAWIAVSITSWAEAASFLAAIYSAILIGEWVWKRLLRPWCVRHGWVR